MKHAAGKKEEAAREAGAEGKFVEKFGDEGLVRG